MKSIARVECVPGMVLGEDVYVNGNLILKANEVLNDTKIDMLKLFSIMCVTIKEDVDLATTHYEKLRFTEEFKTFEKKHSESLSFYKSLVDYFISNKTIIHSSTLLDIYNNMRQYYKNGAQLLDYLYNLTPNADQLTYNHCLNSALLGGIFTEWLQLNEEDKNNLIISCFYYDIGKLLLPYHILWKPDKLTAEEFEMVKKHPVIGYSLIKNCDHLSQTIKNSVIMHHERMNGTGYPYHMHDQQIDTTARYVSVIDTYIAMASARSYRPAFTPMQIIGHFEEHMTEYDVSLVIPLLTHIADSQLGMKVQLNDESEWTIFISNPSKLSCPILKNDKDEILSLSNFPNLSIVKNL